MLLPMIVLSVAFERDAARKPPAYLLGVWFSLLVVTSGAAMVAARDPEASAVGMFLRILASSCFIIGTLCSAIALSPVCDAPITPLALLW